MGNICGKEEADASPPGRVLGSAPAAKTKASVPRKVGGPARTLSDTGGGGGGGGATASSNAGDARRMAAEAAEARAKASSKGGKLQNQLSTQKRQSRTDTLKQASAEERRHREIDQNDASKIYN